MNQEREYVFRFPAGAVSYILALLNRRPREESNEFYLSIEKAVKEQDEQLAKGNLTSTGLPPPEVLEMLGNMTKSRSANGADGDPPGGQP